MILLRSRPATRIVPSVGSISLIKSRITVDLPEPVDPTRNTKSPRSIANVAWSRPRSALEYRLETPRNSTIGGPAGAAPVFCLRVRGPATGAAARGAATRVPLRCPDEEVAMGRGSLATHFLGRAATPAL